MALIPCPECRRDISTRAVACPQCGDPPGGQGDLSRFAGRETGSKLAGALGGWPIAPWIARAGGAGVRDHDDRDVAARAQRMRRLRLALAIAPALALAACGGPAGGGDAAAAGGDAAGDDHIARPSEGTVRAALQGFFDAHPQCTPFFKLPRDVPTGESLRHQQLQGFVDAGLLAKSAEIVTTPGSNDPRDHILRYTAGPNGSEIKPATGNWAGYGAMICYGRRAVTSVSFGTPDDFNRSLSVKYHYRLKDVPPWARTPALAAAYPLFARRLGEEDEGDETLKLAGGDWRLEKQEDNLGFDFLQQGH